MSIIREDPPGFASGGRPASIRYIEIAEKLKADSGNWYKIAEGLKYPEMSDRIKRGHITAFIPKGAFQATARRVNGTYTIYARYVGDAS